ncbi:trace amine-associated receptor 8b-like [Amphiura filiformis]|uniref:trace amine-associated receptor 8b-like n=1 Tax=Amphiura filiformis TaxID=82378 RepID=UPI003B213F43
MSLPSAIAAVLNRWPFGEFLCLLNVLLGGMLFYTVFWSLLAVSVERYIAISKPLRYSQILTPTRGILIVTLIWISSFIYELFVCISNDFIVYYDYATDMCWTLSTTSNGLGIITSLVFCMIIPFLIIVIIYSKILRIARRQAAQIAATMVIPGGKSATVAKKDTKAAITFIIITAGFATGSIPVILIGFYESLTGFRLPEYAQFLAQLLALSNSWWNGVIYSVRNRVFRNTALDVFSKFRKQFSKFKIKQPAAVDSC